jgi:intergrase/recombinase
MTKACNPSTQGAEIKEQLNSRQASTTERTSDSKKQKKKQQQQQQKNNPKPKNKQTNKQKAPRVYIKLLNNLGITSQSFGITL